MKYALVFLMVAAASSLLATSSTFAQEVSQMTKVPDPKASGFAEVNDVRIWYQTYGDGDPLILLHGGFETIESFGPNIAALAKRRRVIGIDLQAHGGTGPLGRQMSFEALASDVAELIKSFGYEKADIMGYSLGGAVALRVSIDHPDVVDRLVLVSTAYAYGNWQEYNAMGMKAIKANPETTAKDLTGTPQHQGYVAKAPGGEETWLDAVKEFGAFIGEDYDWTAEVANVTAPTLIIVADWDAVRIGAATKLYELLGGGAQDAQWDRSGMGQNHFAVIPNATHYDITKSAAISELANPFLDSYPETAAASNE